MFRFDFLIMNIFMNLMIIYLQFYTADVTPTIGNSFTISSPSWFQGLQAEDTLELGYQMTYDGGDEPIVDDIIFNGQSLCDSSASSTTTTASSTPSSTPTPSTCDGGVYNSWDNNVQGTLKFTVPSDIASYVLQLETDIHISNIQVSA